MLPFVTGTPVALGNIGLTVTFTGSDHHPGDFWIIARSGSRYLLQTYSRVNIDRLRAWE